MRPTFFVHCHGPLIREILDFPHYPTTGSRRAGMLLSHLILTLFEWMSAKLADRIVCVSSQTLAHVVRYYKIPMSKCIVIPNGVDPEVFHPNPHFAAGNPPGASPWPKCILYVGRIDPRKRILELAAWYAKNFGILNIPLVIVGRGDNSRYSSQLESCIRQEPVALLRRIDVGDNELCRMYQEAMCLLLPSFSEGQGIVALEANASGCPVVCPISIGENLRTDFSGMMLYTYSGFDDLPEAIRAAGMLTRCERIRQGHSFLQTASWSSRWQRLLAEWNLLARGRK